MPVEHDATSLGELLADHGRGKLVLPNFQREFVWSLDDQQSLVASVVADVPIGSLLLLNGSSDDFSARAIGRRSPTEPAPECSYLLDGQQRISCLGHAVSDPLGSAEEDWHDIVRDTYWNLRYRWLLRVVPVEGERDLFGYRFLNFQGVRVEPDIVKDFVEYKRINIGDEDSSKAWYNPAWLDRVADAEDSVSLARHRLAEAAAQEGLVPLWETAPQSDEAKSLHMRALQILAQAQSNELKARSVEELPQELLDSIWNARPDLDAKNLDETTLAQAIGAIEQRWVQQVGAFLSKLTATDIPIVSLPSDEVDRAVAIFEVMNQGGTPLTTFDLVVARMARLNPERSLAQQLLEHVRGFSVEISSEFWGFNAGPRPKAWSASDELGIAVDKDSLTSTFKNAFLNVLSILVHADDGAGELNTDHIRKNAILSLSASDIDENWKTAADAVLRSWAFLQLRCGIRIESDLRNKLLILPLSYSLRSPQSITVRETLDRSEYWYWCSTLSGTYSERQNDNAIEDIVKLSGWIEESNSNPFTSRQPRALRAEGYSDDKTLLRQHDDAGVASDVGIYLLSYVLSRSPVDFLEPDIVLQPWKASLELEDHHIIPLSNAATVEQSARDLRASKRRIHPLNSPLNRTFITRKSNRKIAGMQVSKYLEDVATKSALNHCLPDKDDFFYRKENESERDYYERFLQRRLELIRAKLDEELLQLKHA